MKQIINEKQNVPKQNFEEIGGVFLNEKVQKVVAVVKKDSIERKESFEQKICPSKRNS